MSEEVPCKFRTGADAPGSEATRRGTVVKHVHAHFQVGGRQHKHQQPKSPDDASARQIGLKARPPHLHLRHTIAVRILEMKPRDATWGAVRRSSNTRLKKFTPIPPPDARANHFTSQETYAIEPWCTSGVFFPHRGVVATARDIYLLS